MSADWWLLLILGHFSIFETELKATWKEVKGAYLSLLNMTKSIIHKKC